MESLRRVLLAIALLAIALLAPPAAAAGLTILSQAVDPIGCAVSELVVQTLL